MSKRRVAIVAMLLAGLLSLTISPISAVADGQTWSVSTWEMPFEGPLNKPSLLDTSVIVQPSSDPTDSVREYWCTDMTGPNCKPDTIERASLVMPLCAEVDAKFCIQGLKFTLADGTEYESHLVRGFNQTPSVALPERGLPSGSTGQLWSAPASLKDEGIDGFYVEVREEFMTLPGSENNYLKQWHTTAVLVPYKGVLAPEARTPQYQPNRSELNGKPWIFYTLMSGNCLPATADTRVIWQGDGECGLMANFPEGLRPELSFRDSPSSSNWFNARLDDPKLSSVLGPLGRAVTISGLPVTIPTVSYGGDMTVAASDALKTGWNADQIAQSTHWLIPSNHQQALRELNAVLPLGNDTTTSELQVWSFSSVATAVASSKIGSCAARTQGVAGMVFMNGTVFDAGMPTLEDGSLNFHVASPHFAVDGKTPNEGSYTMILDDNVARCIYGFSNDPVQASISVWTADGQEKAATTIVSDKDGWLKLTARGFTYSSPTIKATLTQPESPTPTPVQSQGSSNGSSVKKTTITCVKGKVTKKITGSAPKCPAGYKKKA